MAGPVVLTRPVVLSVLEAPTVLEALAVPAAELAWMENFA